MQLDQMKEQFSHAYVKAVAAASGVAWSKPSVDDDSIDLTLSRQGGNGVRRSPKLDLQLKCKASETPTGDRFSHSIKIKNYNDLRSGDVFTPKILVVVLVPDDPKEWLNQTSSELVMRRCAFWRSLRGLPASDNTTGQTVDMLTAQVFDVATLSEMMDRIGEGGLP